MNWLWTDRKVGGGTQLRSQPYARVSIPNTFHIGVIGVQNGSFVPTEIGGSCLPLHINLSKPYVLFSYTTDKIGEFYSDFITAPFPGGVGLVVWSQAAYMGPNKSFQLTRAGTAPIAAVPTGTVAFEQRLYYPDKIRPIAGYRSGRCGSGRPRF